MILRLTLPVLAFTCISLIGRSEDTARPEAKLQYNRDVRPILAENCFACHGADSAARKAKLRLDDREAAIEKGAIAPGKVSESEMIARILMKDEDEGVMPPVKSHKKLKPAQKEILKKWVEQGAVYEPHWAFIAPKIPRIPAPSPKKPHHWDAKNAIDEFTYGSMVQHGLHPNPEADRRTLARRLSLDLTGLPPEPADVEEFVNDKSETWYEKYVDKLMASPHWGEHRGRYWLDAARYADTHGIHFDNYREMYSYRDWVINAFNQNMKFDQFTIEQLAGDLLPNATLDQKIATGFNRNNITTNEGGLIDEEYLVLYTRDRTDTANTVFMGLTTGCAVCHDHKFDPVSQREFYSMAAFFNNTTQGARDGNIQNTPPIIVVPKMEDKAAWLSLQKQTDELRAKLAARKQDGAKDFTKWLATAKPSLVLAKVPAGEVFSLPLDEGKGNEIIGYVRGEATAVKFKDGYAWTADKVRGKTLAVKPGASLEFDAGDFDASKPFAVSVWVKVTKRGQNGAILARMDDRGGKFRGWDLWIENDRIASHVIHNWPERSVKNTAKQSLKLNEWTHVTVSYDGRAHNSGLQIYYNGDLQPFDYGAEGLKAADDIHTKVPLKIGQRHNSGRVTAISLEDVKLYDRQISAAEAEQLAKAPQAAEILRKEAAKRTAAEKDQLYDWWLNSNDAVYASLDAELAKLAQQEIAIKSRGTVAHVSNEKPGMAEAFVLNRGEYDQRRDKLTADTPKSLPPFPNEFPRNRLGYAKWLLLKEHPLTARVTVNRFWQELFGQGLVRTAGDFGIAGELPSHPELLDFLALDFQKDWDVKRFFKMLVMSATYRQSAAVTKEKLEKDPNNIWLSRGPRFRMDAEMIRDYALASSGLLVKKIGGPSVKPYQPDGVWEAVAMIGSNTRNYKRDNGEALYRRSLYTFWKRAAPPASMEVLNAPNRETCCVKRDRTNTPLQALLTLNDVQFVEAARALAEMTLKSADKDEARVDFLAKRLLARSLTPQERAIVMESLGVLVKEFTAKPEEAKKLIAFGDKKADAGMDPASLAAWTMLANEMLNLDEVLNK